MTATTYTRDERLQASRLLIAVFYDPPSAKFKNWLVDRYCVRPTKRQHPGMDTNSEDFLRLLPDLPRRVEWLFDLFDRRHARLIRKWALADVDKGRKPPKRWRR